MARRTRQTDSGRASLTASARKVSLQSPGVRLELGLDQAWQKDAWSYWRRIPEVKQLILFLGNQLAKLRIFVAVDDPNDPEGDPMAISAEGSPVPEAVQVAAMAELARLMTHDGGLPELMRRLDMNLEIPGEAYLVGLGARTVGDPDPTKTGDQTLTKPLPEEWRLCSKSEIKTEGQGIAARTTLLAHPGDQTGRRLDKEFDTIIRIYQPDPEWSALADSAMQGILFDCRILMALTAQVLAVANSQMHAGILTIPNELSFGPAAPVENDDGTSAASEDPLDRELDEVFSEVVETPDSLMTIRPTLLRGPAQYLGPDYVRYIEMGRKLDEKLDAQIEQRVRRIARGLNAPVETVEGLDATTFANAKQVDRDLFDDHIEPRATMMVGGLSTGFLQPNLLDAATTEDPDTGVVTTTDQELATWAPQLYFWYDPASIIREPDTEIAADRAHELGTISDAAHRKAKGFSEDDAPDALELVVRAGLRRGTLDPAITVALLQEIAAEAGIDLPDVAAVTDQGAAGAPPDQMRLLGLALWLRERRDAQEAGDAPLIIPATATVTGAAEIAGPNPGANLLAIDTELRTRLLVASNDAMERALERAGNRLRSKVASSHRSMLDGLPPREFARALGPGLVAAADIDLTGSDTWAGLAPSFEEWVRVSQRRALDELNGIVGGLPNRDDLEARQDEDRSAAWAWLVAALTALLAERIYNPSPDAPAVGEHDTTLVVPTGIIRAAIARAGGTGGAEPSPQAGAVLAEGGTRPVGGVGTGELVQQQLRDFGATVRAYRWVYGPALRATFLPHAQLDGTVFTAYDDGRLTNGSGFPPFPYYLPGDHYGCRCDVELVIVPPEQLSTLGG